MQRTKPPFRADHVGSLLRPAALKEAREKRAKGEITPAELKAVEDREIERVIKKQEEVGLQGRHRRRVPPLLVAPRFPLGARRLRALRDGAGHRVRRRADPRRGRPRRRQGRLLQPSDARAFQVRAAHTKRTPKITIPAPSAAYGRRGRDADRREGLSRRSRNSSTISARPTARRCAPSPTPAAAICSSTRSIIAMLCDPKYRKSQSGPRRRSAEARRALRRPDQHGDVGHPLRHDDHHASVPRQLPIDLSWARAATTRSPRCCSTASRCTAISWNTTPTAPATSSRCKHMPKGQTVVLGIVTTKTGKLESKDELKRRIDEAAKFVEPRPALPLRRSAASPRPRRAIR